MWWSSVFLGGQPTSQEGVASASRKFLDPLTTPVRIDIERANSAP